jgi:hypothetical protein
MHPSAESLADPPPLAGGSASSSACYGFEVRSSLPLQYLRPGAGPPLTVTEGEEIRIPESEPVRRWIPRPEHPFEADLYRDGDLFTLWIKDTGLYVIDPTAPSIQVPLNAEPVSREERLWGFPAALCFIERGDLPLHAAAVEAGSRSLLLAAPGRFGKTTLASAFLRAGPRVLSEDISCLSGIPPSVVPGPAMLRVRHDSYERMEFPGTHRVGADEDRVHLALDENARGDGKPVPLAGVVLLRKGDGPATLERVPAPDAVQDLWALSFKISTEADRIRCFEAVVTLADTVPVWNLSRQLVYAEIDQLVDILLTTCLTDR